MSAEANGRLSVPITLVRAAEYVRMSTEGQQYSIGYQQLAIRQYALMHGMAVVRTYADEGISGLTFNRRPALVRLLSDVQNARADFETILVYDVSRWGRFQDTDESAHYEYLCRSAGIRIEYCAEPFANEIGPLTAIYKNIKRAMAAEFSREQSHRVHRAISQAASRGYFTGGPPGLGFCRMLVGADGRQKRLLRKGQQRDIRGDHIILVPGPSKEVRIVRRIFDLCANKKYSPRQIVAAIHKEFGRKLGEHAVRGILGNERYVGTSVYNRGSRRLRGKRIVNAEAAWIRVPHAYEPIISAQLFARTQKAIRARGRRRYTENELLDRLRFLLKKHGRLSFAIIRAEGHPDYCKYRSTFGGLRQAYAKLGYIQEVDKFHDLERAARVRRTLLDIKAKVIENLQSRGHKVELLMPSRLIAVDDVLTVALNAAPYTLNRHALNEPPERYLEVRRYFVGELAIVACLDRENEKAEDFLLIPGAEVARRRFWLTEQNVAKLGGRRNLSLPLLIDEVSRKAVSLRDGLRTARVPIGDRGYRHLKANRAT